MHILVIANSAFSQTANNGKTYETMFSAFKKENLAQLLFRPQKDDIDFEYCPNNYFVSEVDIINRLFLRTKNCGRKLESSESVKQQSGAYRVKSNSIKRNPLLRDLLWKTNLWKTKELKKWCTDLHADLIFFVGAGQSFAYEIALYVADYLRLPLVIYFMDDYLINPQCRTLSEKIQRKRMQAFYAKAVNRAELHFCIGEMMAEAYSRYFKKTFQCIMNSAEILPYEKPVFGEKIQISYFGGLHLERWKMISRFAKLTPPCATVHIYTFTPIDEGMKKAFAESNVILHNGVSGLDLHRAMVQSHVLLHAESDDAYYRSLTKLSVSTKIPEYLAHGRLVIGFGPTEVASLRLLSDHRIGVVLSSSESDDILQNKLAEILSDSLLMSNLGQEAYSYATRNFDKGKIARDFKSQLHSVVNRNIKE